MLWVQPSLHGCHRTVSYEVCYRAVACYTCYRTVAKKTPMTIHAIRDLAAAVRGRRKDLGFNQADLARRAGVSRKWIYEFEAGKPTAEFGLVLRVLDELGLALELAPRSDQGPAARGDPVDLDALLDEHRGR
jgi:HTH-type transcriptional regulator / antitoxin HipB